ncbi:MAG: YeeE/YedE family protein [Methylococcus sp.]|nr:MAG: YeeE/YedE family protein [Methylococcus sp.]HIA20624.1 YeeE/YedE family protein [Planctomycetaceae bacterium]
MENFSPVSALTGGALIGLAASLLLLFNGRIAGISGILAGSLFLRRQERWWRLLFLAGMVAGASLYQHFGGDLSEARTGYPLPLLIIGGLLVGFGTRLGSGCTSGHGVCGLARHSPRSIVATLVFMAFGGISVYLARHVFGLWS